MDEGRDCVTRQSGSSSAIILDSALKFNSVMYCRGRSIGGELDVGRCNRFQDKGLMGKRRKSICLMVKRIVPNKI